MTRIYSNKCTLIKYLSYCIIAKLTKPLRTAHGLGQHLHVAHMPVVTKASPYLHSSVHLGTIGTGTDGRWHLGSEMKKGHDRILQLTNTPYTFVSLLTYIPTSV